MPQSDSEAVKWCRLSAYQGNAAGQGFLADMYENGKGVSKNYAYAARWYKYAAWQGEPFAEARLADMYDKGRGVSMNKAEAYKWLSLSAAQKNEFAEQALRNLEPSLSADQIAEAQNKARSFTASPPMSNFFVHVMNGLDDTKL